MVTIGYEFIRCERSKCKPSTSTRMQYPLQNRASRSMYSQVHGGPFFSLFLRCFFDSLFTYFLGRFGGHFGSLLASIFHHFFTLKNDRFFDAFWDAFWMDFGGPDPRKWSSRLSETLILIKTPFSSHGRF